MVLHHKIYHNLFAVVLDYWTSTILRVYLLYVMPHTLVDICIHVLPWNCQEFKRQTTLPK